MTRIRPELQTSLKSNFVLPFFGLQMLVTTHAAVTLFRIGFSPAWLAPLLCAGGFLVIISSVVVRGSPRTHRNLPGLLALTLAGVVLGLVGESAGALPATYLALSASSNLLYVFWYSRFGRRESAAIAVGRILPDVPLLDSEGHEISSAEFRGTPSVLLFYRGNWCPLCMAQIKEVAGQYREISKRGAQVVLISPQDQQKTRALAAKFDVPFRFFVDAGGRAAQALGILHRGGLPSGMGVLGYDYDTVLPTVIVTDAQGKILLSDQTDNYRVRPEPEIFLRALDSAFGT